MLDDALITVSVDLNAYLGIESDDDYEEKYGSDWGAACAAREDDEDSEFPQICEQLAAQANSYLGTSIRKHICNAIFDGYHFGIAVDSSVDNPGMFRLVDEQADEEIEDMFETEAAAIEAICIKYPDNDM